MNPSKYKYSKYTSKEIEKVGQMLKFSKYLLLTGGVGVGKTLYAKEIAQKLIGSGGECEFFAFGPNVSYENLIYGINVGCNNGALELKLGEQRFALFCRKAKENQGKKYVAIFDDINRADISRALGDLLSAMESKDVGNALHAGNKTISLPDNLYIIATANPLTGRESLDYAWMRRFAHYNILPDERHFGFEWDGSDARDEYQGKYKLFFKLLRKYQWDIFMHVRIMYDRYYIEPEDHNKKNQYMPGHGLFLTYVPDSRYGDNLVLFHKKLQHVIVPLLEKQMEDGVLRDGARLDIKALEEISCGKDSYCFGVSEKWADGAEGRAKICEIRKYIKKLIQLPQNPKITWAEVYMFFCCPLSLRRLDAVTLQLYKNNKSNKNLIDALREGIVEESWLIERVERAEKHRAGNSSEGNLYTHGKKTTLQICEETLCSPTHIVKDRPYNVCKNGIQKRYKVDDISEELKKIERSLKGRKTIMNNSSFSNSSIKKPIEIMDHLNVRQMILQGPPGTSKTYGAKYDIIVPVLKEVAEGEEKFFEDRKLLEEYMIKNYGAWEKPCGWDMVQFHPSYGYEDFVRGITVTTDQNKNVIYETVNKILGKMCGLASKYKDNEESKFFLIIDEINRADIATVFGELIYALECRGEKISIPYAYKGDYELEIPKNLYIIGTMNTADKSIGTIDYAIRRRFLFFDCLPNQAVVENYIEKANQDLKDKANQDLKDKAVNLMRNLKTLVDISINKNYHAKDLYIGHTYFLVTSEDELKLRLQYQILPILREYYENGVLSGVDDANWKGKFSNVAYEGGIDALKELKDYLQGKTDSMENVDNIYNLLISYWEKVMHHNVQI